MTLNEGGNVFANAEPFDQKFVPDILKTINGALNGTGITAIPVGSAATPNAGKFSGDMDVIVDEKNLLDYFKAKDAKTARKALSDFINQQGLETAQSGINVHVNVPVGNSHHQVDIMVAGNAERVAKFHTHDIPPRSPYKGVNKQLMLAILAKSKGYMWSAWQGLFSRTSEGKKGDFVTDDLDQIAEILTGVGNSKVLGSVESILKALPNDEAAALLDRAKQDPNWVEKQANEDISRIKKLAGLKETISPSDIPQMPDITGLQPGAAKDLGDGQRIEILKNGTISYTGGFGAVVYDKSGKAIKYQSPNFAGLTKIVDLTTGEVVDDYSAGPLQIRKTTDAGGKAIKTTANYNIGTAKFGAEKDHVSGINTTTATSTDPNVDPNQLLPTKDIAAAKGVDPKKFARFQRQNPAATEELNKMLQIARLR